MITEPIFVKNVACRVTSSGNPYQILDLIGLDQNLFKGVVWEPTSVMNANEQIEAGNVYLFEAEEVEYRRGKQLKIYWAEKTNLGSASFFTKETLKLEELESNLKKLLTAVSTPSYKAVIEKIFSKLDLISKLKILPKTLTYDYCHVGGLLESTFCSVELAFAIADILFTHHEISSRDLIMTASFLLDIGKVFELTSEFKKTQEGEYVGHQVLGCSILDEIDKDLDYKFHQDILKLKHCILVHHTDDLGQWSPVKILLKEADVVRRIHQLVLSRSEWDAKNIKK